MMNEKTINEQYAYIRTLLEEKRLKEAPVSYTHLTLPTKLEV